MKAIVTGGTAGIGRELVLALAKSGWQVTTTGRNEDALAELDQLDGITAVKCDLSDPDAIAAFVQQVAGAAPFDMLVNNAGVMWTDGFADMTSAGIFQEIAVNLTAPILLTQHLLPHLKPDAQLVNVGSALGYFPRKGSAVYSATKAGLRLFGEALSVQYPDLCIQHVVPPRVNTGLSTASGPQDMGPKEAAQAILQGIVGKSKTIWVGDSKKMRMLMRIAPWLIRRIIARH